jgi:arsenate reductase
MNTLFHLGTCSTCQRILNELAPLPARLKAQEIKSTPITEEQLNEMKRLAGSYEALFSRRAMKYRSMGLGEKELSETDFKELILNEYTFLKRPVLVWNDEIFIGSAKKTVEAAKAALHV